MTTINDLDDFKALEPFFRIIEQGRYGELYEYAADTAEITRNLDTSAQRE
jgi:hypothetical protein